jgi:hypothetical protein
MDVVRQILSFNAGRDPQRLPSAQVPQHAREPVHVPAWDLPSVLRLSLARRRPLTAHLKVAQPKWKSEAHHVVALQRRLQAVSMAFLQPLILGGAA